MGNGDDENKNETANSYRAIIKKDGTMIVTDLSGWFDEIEQLRSWQDQPNLEALPDFCSVDDLAPVLGINRNTLYHAIREQDFPARKIGRRTLISKAAVVKWFEKNGVEE